MYATLLISRIQYDRNVCLYIRNIFFFCTFVQHYMVDWHQADDDNVDTVVDRLDESADVDPINWTSTDRQPDVKNIHLQIEALSPPANSLRLNAAESSSGVAANVAASPVAIAKKPRKPYTRRIKVESTVEAESNVGDDDYVPPADAKRTKPGPKPRQSTKADSKQAKAPKMEQCEVCGFISRSLKTHMMTHTNEKRFECDFCGKKFSLRSSMKNHLFAHVNIR